MFPTILPSNSGVLIVKNVPESLTSSGSRADEDGPARTRNRDMVVVVVEVEVIAGRKGGVGQRTDFMLRVRQGLNRAEE